MPQDRAEQERIGATVRALREARGLTLDDLAAAVGLSRPYLSNIEAGRKRIKAERIPTFAAALGVPPAALIRPDLYGDAA
jgi:transcriptional regulator with XRE-family HTH domain